MPDEIRRFPAVKRQVVGINETDVRVSVIGTIIDKQDDFIIVDDGTGRVKISAKDLPFGQTQMIRVFGRVMPTPDGIELQGEIFQDMSKLDLVLFKKLEKLEALNRSSDVIAGISE